MDLIKQTGFKRKMLLATLIVAAVFLSGCIAETPRVYHIGILSGTDAFLPIADGFKAKMTELGYVEGKNIVYDLKKAPSGQN